MTAAELRRQFPRAPESFIARNATPEDALAPKRRSLAQMTMDAFERLEKAGKLPPAPPALRPPMKPFSAFIPLPIISEANTREHWRAKAERVAKQREKTAFYLRSELAGNPKPCSIELYRQSPRKLDDDNLANAFKHVRDEIAAILGFDDRDESVKWIYRQGRHLFPLESVSGFGIKITWPEPVAHCPHCHQALPRPPSSVV